MNRLPYPRPHPAIYSPPQIDKRLPKEEPGQKKAKSMTIVAGFRCRDGVLLLADSQHTIGDARYKDPKLWRIDLAEEGSTLIVTAAGVDSIILETVDSLIDAGSEFKIPITFTMIEATVRDFKLGNETVILIGTKLSIENESRLIRVMEDEQGEGKN